MKIFVFEGPSTIETLGKMQGWRHYQVLRGGRSDSFVSRPDRAKVTAETLGAKFFPAGTWEAADVPAKETHFPCPRPEILAELHGLEQPEIAL